MVIRELTSIGDFFDDGDLTLRRAETTAARLDDLFRLFTVYGWTRSVQCVQDESVG